MTAIRGATYIALCTVRFTFRDKTASFFLLALPLIVIGIIGTTFKADNGRPIGVVDLDQSQASHDLVRALYGDRVVKARVYSTPASLNLQIRRQALTAGLVIPKNFQRDLLAGKDVEAQFVLEREENIPAAVRASVQSDVSAVAEIYAVAGYTARTTLRPVANTLPIVSKQFANSAVRVDVQNFVERGTVAPNGVQYTGPANLVLFITVNVLASSVGLVAARLSGVCRRAVAMGQSAWMLTFGEGLGRFFLGLMQALIITIAGSVLFGIYWGPLIPLAMVVIATCAISAGAAIWLAAIARSPEQALAIAVPAGLVAGMLGGCMWPLSIVGPILRNFGHAFPTAWEMDAVLSLSGHGSNSSLVVPIVVLAAFAIALAILAGSTFKRRIFSES